MTVLHPDPIHDALSEPVDPCKSGGWRWRGGEMDQIGALTARCQGKEGLFIGRVRLEAGDEFVGPQDADIFFIVPDLPARPKAIDGFHDIGTQPVGARTDHIRTGESNDPAVDRVWTGFLQPSLLVTELRPLQKADHAGIAIGAQDDEVDTVHGIAGLPPLDLLIEPARANDGSQQGQFSPPFRLTADEVLHARMTHGIVFAASHHGGSIRHRCPS